ncbi:FAD-dependent oxidoreductase, partial [Actinophytocola gossypii]
MGRERIVVVGGGAAGLRAAERLRELNFGGELVVIGEEPYRTYHRPGLTKHLLTGIARPRELVLPVLTDLDAIWRYGVRASHLEPDEHVLHLPGGEEIPYDGLVVATGAQARHLPGAPRHDPRVHVVRTVSDAVAVQKSLRRGKGGLAVVGSGFLACELASAARALGRDATIVTKDRGLLTRVPGADLGETVTALQEAHGVQIVTEAEVHHWVRQQDGVAMHLTTGQVVVASCVVLAVGAVPAVSWLRGSGLILDDGVMCDATCHAIGAEDIVVAGDVARWPNLRFDTQPRRVEHWLNAVEMGRAAAENLLAGASSAKPYTPLPRFWTDQHGLRIQGAGLPALAQDTVELAGSVDVGQRVTGYVSNGELVGVVGFDSPRGMLHWTAELESRTTEAMERRPAPARREPARPAPAEVSWPSLAAIEALTATPSSETVVAAPATQAIPVHAMSAMEAAAAMDAAVARAMDSGASSGDSWHRRPSEPSRPSGAARGSGGQVPGFGPLDPPPLGPEDSWPSMPAAGAGASWPELPSVQAMDSWLSMPAVDSAPRLPAVRPEPERSFRDTERPAGRRARADDAPPSPSLAGALDAVAGRRARPEPTESIPVVRETNLTRSERRAQAAEVTSAIPPVPSDSPRPPVWTDAPAPDRRPVPADYSSRTGAPRESSNAPAMASVPVRRPEPPEAARTGELPAVDAGAPARPMFSAPMGATASSPGSPPVRPTFPPPTRARFSAPESRPTSPRTHTSAGMSPARAATSQRRMAPVPPPTASSPGMRRADPMASSPRMLPPTGPFASSPGFPPDNGTPPANGSAFANHAPRGLPRHNGRFPTDRSPNDTSPGMPRHNGPPAGARPANGTSPGMPAVDRIPPGMPRANGTSPGMPPASGTSPGMPRANGTSPGMPPPHRTQPGMPPGEGSSSGRWSADRVSPGVPSANGSSPGMSPAYRSQPGMPPGEGSSSGRWSADRVSPGVPSANGSSPGMSPAYRSQPGMPPGEGSSSGRWSADRVPPGTPSANDFSSGMPPVHRVPPGVPSANRSSPGMPPATASSPGMPPVNRGASTASRMRPPQNPTASSPGMPAIARDVGRSHGSVPDTPPRDRLFASIPPTDDRAAGPTPAGRAAPSAPPEPTFSPPDSRAAPPPPPPP